MERVALGSTGLTVSRLAFGTGSHGWDHRSEQTDLGIDGLADLLCQAQKINHACDVNALPDCSGNNGLQIALPF